MGTDRQTEVVLSQLPEDNGKWTAPGMVGGSILHFSSAGDSVPLGHLGQQKKMSLRLVSRVWGTKTMKNILHMPRPSWQTQGTGSVNGDTVQTATLPTSTYFPKTLNRISLLLGLSFTFCQMCVFQGSTYRKEGRYDSGRCLG